MSVHRPSDVLLPANLKKQDPQGLGKQLVYGVSELAVATTMAAVAAIEGSAAVCSQFTHSNGQNTTAPGQGFCSTAETLSQGTWIPTSYGLVPYVGAAAALGVDGVRRIYNVTKVGFLGVKEDGKKAWKIFKDKATSMNKKYPAMAAGLVTGFFTSGLTVATAALGCGAYVAADLYNDYIAEPGVKKKEPSGFSAPSLVVDESEESEEDEPVVGMQESAWGASSLYGMDDGAEELYAPPASQYQRPALRKAHFRSALSSAAAVNFFDAQAPATGKIRVKIQGRTYTFSNIRAAFYAHRYPSQAVRFVGKSAEQAEALASSLSDDAQDPRWAEKNLQAMYFVVGLRLRNDPAARAELRTMSDAQIDQLNTDFNGIGAILKRIRDWDKMRSTPVDDSYPRQVAALARIRDAL